MWKILEKLIYHELINNFEKIQPNGVPPSYLLLPIGLSFTFLAEPCWLWLLWYIPPFKFISSNLSLCYDYAFKGISWVFLGIFGVGLESICLLIVVNPPKPLLSYFSYLSKSILFLLLYCVFYFYLPYSFCYLAFFKT